MRSERGLTPEAQVNKVQQFERLTAILEDNKGIKELSDEENTYRAGELWKIREAIFEELIAEGLTQEQIDEIGRKNRMRVGDPRVIVKSSYENHPEAIFQRADQMEHMMRANVEFHAECDDKGTFTYMRKNPENGYANAIELTPNTEVVLIKSLEKRYKEVANEGYQDYAERVIQDTYQSLSTEDIEDINVHARGLHFDEGESAI